MKLLSTFPLLVALAAAYPYSKEEEKLVFTKEYYPDHLVIYEGKYDIADIMVPLNSASEDYGSESSESSEDLKKHMMIFFSEAEFKNGRREDKGIYMHRDGVTKKVMEKGRAFAASADDSKYVFIGAKDGLYVYDHDSEKAVKYGKFEHSIKDMAKETNTDVIYILTEDREMYKVYDAASIKEKMDDIKDAEQIVVDYANNLYYYGDDKKPYVRTVDGEIKKIEGLPEAKKEVRLFRPSLYHDVGAKFMIDNEMYTIYPDGSSSADNFKFMEDAKPSAYSMEAAIFRYFGYQKKIYEYDFMSLVDSSESEESKSKESKSKESKSKESKSDESKSKESKSKEDSKERF